MPVSIQDVARKAGVAIGTVSRAFNNYADIRPETKQRILAAAAELGYTPNVSARNLSAKRPPNICLIVSGLLEDQNKDNLVYPLLQGIMTYTTQHKLELVLYTTDSTEQRKQSYTEFCNMHSITGTILSGIKVDDAYCTELLDSGIPSVLIDVSICTPTVGWVSVDNRAAAKEAVARLISTGHREIVIVGGKQNAQVNTVRLRGVRDAFEEAGLLCEDSHVLCGEFLEESAYRAFRAYLSRCEKRPDGVFCFSDSMAIGVMRAAREAGLRIPEEMSLIGFDGLRASELTYPPLSTVEQDVRSLGYVAAEEVHQMMLHEHEGRHRLLPHQLLLRESFRPRL